MAGSDIKTRPWCPFCGQNIARPRHADKRKLGEFPVGECQCGAVYASDATGHNVGSAMIESLVYACGDNWDLAWELIPEDDYLTGRIENYDEQTNQVVETRNLDGRAVRGVIYFVRLHKEEIAEIAARIRKHGEAASEIAVRGVLPASIPELEPERDPKRTRLRASKTQVKKLVLAEDIDALVDLGFDDKKTLRFMQRLLYNPVEDQRWATAYVLGQVCARLSTRKPGPVADLMHRLFVACSDSAAASWGAVEAIGSIIAARSDLYGAFTRHLLNYLNDDSTRLQVLWALGTVAESRPDLIRKMPFYDLFDLFDSPEPAVRGLSVRLFGNIRAREVVSRIESLLDDTSAVTYYNKGKAVSSSVGQLAEEALGRIKER